MSFEGGPWGEFRGGPRGGLRGGPLGPSWVPYITGDAGADEYHTTKSFFSGLLSSTLGRQRRASRLRLAYLSGLPRACDSAVTDGKPHKHAFVLSPEVEFYCDVEAQQYGPPLVRSGLRGLRVLKTAQSGFEGFAREGFTSLEESRDRLFCTEMEPRWAFQRGLPLSARDYDEARERVRACLLEAFAGPPDTGVYSPSVQRTLYLAGQSVLQSLPHTYETRVEDIRITMPNLHYTPIDLRKLGLKNNDQTLAIVAYSMQLCP
ncbi:uricase-like [Lethenteron reissneri]|uniref:uricase-like n=1 Tax=Lethenteron reissneri TaxID=7753 RepID=UPI002AB7279B|nr:uricase-like [Lethenteron reissneri]